MEKNTKSFIEVQFPVSRVSKESFKERKAVQSQTLTGLGKWWGRKPLVLIRAAILGLLLPATDDPVKDREIFNTLLTMNEEGLWLRKNKDIDPAAVNRLLTQGERKKYFTDVTTSDNTAYRSDITREEKQQAQKLAFYRLTYDQKLDYCMRPEQVEELGSPNWDKINAHLGTSAFSLVELVKQLGIGRFGNVPLLGDCFCGGGSIPFEAARIGCDVYASDLNPVAVLLTWAGLNIGAASGKEIEGFLDFQRKVFDRTKSKVDALGIEKNESGWTANIYLYCTEAACPSCGFKVPLSTSWLVGQGSRTVAVLEENAGDRSFNIRIAEGATDKQIKDAVNDVTIKNGEMLCPHCGISTPVQSLRKDKKDSEGNVMSGLRKWEKSEFTGKPEDVYSERLYCIRYVETYIDDKGSEKTLRHYVTPTREDINRENKVIEFLSRNIERYQALGYIPDTVIEEGYNTSQLIREKGWKYWHQLFTPRQILTNLLLLESIDELAVNAVEKSIGILGVNKCLDWNSRLCRWGVGQARESMAQTFYNQAFNTIFQYGTKGLDMLEGSWYLNYEGISTNNGNFTVETGDAREVTKPCNIWITDPPYADAVNYHELTEFFLAWDKKLIHDISENWYSDSKRILAVKGKGKDFNLSMVEIYSNLSGRMSDNDVQIVMFTHQDVNVWAELTLILWAAGLRVTAAWNIATETESGGLKDGNYVKGTVVLVLRKQISDSTAYLDELYPEIEDEVKRQIESMRKLDDREDPNFSDADYLLAAYAASLKVLTSYRQIEDIDITYELSRTRSAGEVSPVENIINEAVKLAYDCLIPAGFDSYTWRLLIPEERFYIKGLDLEKSGIYQLSAYQELARGFGVKDYKALLESTKANQARLKTALEYGLKGLSDSDRFGCSLLRIVLAALNQSIQGEDTAAGRNWLKNEVPNYWGQRNTIVEILDYISALGHIENMPHWVQEAHYAGMLRERVRDDGV